LKSGYEVTGNILFMTSKLHTTKNTLFLCMDDIEEIADENASVTKIRLGHQAGGSTYYECSLEDLRLFVETSESLEITLRKGKEGYLVPIEDSPFIKQVNKSSDGDRWLAQRAKIIEEGGGPWSEAQRLAWKDKFSYKPLAKQNV